MECVTVLRSVVRTEAIFGADVWRLAVCQVSVAFHGGFWGKLMPFSFEEKPGWVMNPDLAPISTLFDL